MFLGKIFMSHKSENKDFVEYVVNKIGRDRCVYDKYTFDEGDETIEEIIRGLNQTDLFVIFLTKAALNSKWVKRELMDAHKRLNEKQISAIYPIIIENDLRFDDKLIPKWMQSHYNIKPILSPKIAYQKIMSKLREISWGKSETTTFPIAFFGRNDEVKQFETRYSDLDKETLKCVVASGFEYIGRKSYMEYCLKKLNIMRSSNKYTLIYLDRDESIEDFIIKIMDTGLAFTDKKIQDIICADLEKKIEYVSSIIIQIQNSKQYVFVNDNGVIVKPSGEVADWFKQILATISNCIVFGISSKYKVKSYKSVASIFSISINELNSHERQAMLIKTCNDLELEVTKDDLKCISEILSGYPQQVLLASKMIEEDGIMQTIDNLYVIRDYSKDKAYMAIRFFEGNTDAMNFLNFLCSIDFVDTEILYKIFSNNSALKDIFYQFISMSICNYIGSDMQYICVSNIIRDYITRNKIELNEYYKVLLNSFVENNITNNWIEDVTLATYYSTIKQKLLKGDIPPKEIVLPSHYIKSIVQLYNNQKYKTLIKLAKSIIDNNTVVLFDKELKREFYTFFCQALAREHDNDFFNYYEKVELTDFDKKFLLGFYYRINNNPERAISNLLAAININPRSPRAKRELVNSFIILDDYDSAYIYSKENYESDTSNPYYIQSYFKCIINSNDFNDCKSLLDILLDDIAKIKSPIAQDMFAELKALYEYRVNNEAETANRIIDAALLNCERRIYLLLTKFDIAYYASNNVVMGEVLKQLKLEADKNTYYSNALNVRLAKFAYREKKPKAEIQSYIAKLKCFPENNKKKLLNSLEIF